MKKTLTKINKKEFIDFKKLYKKFSILELHCTTFSKEIYNRNISISCLQNRLLELTSTFNNKDYLIDSQNNIINNYVLEKNNLKNKIERLEKDNKYLKTEIIELQQRIKEIETSTFWKILKPVRKIFIYFKNKK
jgi:peptidoglycan hydrolase CwlO-like protein